MIVPRVRVVTPPDRSRQELVLGHSELPRQHKAEGAPVQDRVRGLADRKISQNLEGNATGVHSAGAADHLFQKLR